MSTRVPESMSLVSAHSALEHPLFQKVGVRVTAGWQADRMSAAAEAPEPLEIAPGGPRPTFLIDRVWRGYNVLNGVKMMLALGLLIAWLAT